MSSFDPLGLRPNDPLERWRDDAERRERDLARARREREERRTAEANDCARLRVEFEAWRAKQAEDRRQEMTAVGEFIDECIEKLIDRFEEQSQRSRNALMDAVEARFTALEMQLKTVESRARGQFQFARERDADDLLPNPLSLRRH